MVLNVVSFKDLVSQDIGVFLNDEEFADKFVINKKEVAAVLDQAIDSDHPLAYAEGVSLVTHVLYVSEAELGYVPEPNEMMVINGQRYRVDRVGDDMGLLTISLEANIA
ncbi:hypothetical protein [Paenibacillus odorifer]|uniref:hypothetical protein n=1 Tax=Paenibacillus odorifer TaxID=189426 RepID=UPI0011156B93|nr:hypothetical protein [Paenibacillus odorifer]